MKITKAKLSDSKDILALYRGENFLQGRSGGKETEYELVNIKDYISRKNSSIFIAIMDKEIVGCLHVIFFVDYAMIEHLVVKKEYRNNGVATSLFKHLEDEMKKRKIKIVEVMTNTKNKIMQNFLEKEGYKRGYSLYCYDKLI